jgi:dynein heavy chain
MLIERKRPVMLVGTAGTGKTVLMQGKLSDLSDEYKRSFSNSF